MAVYEHLYGAYEGESHSALSRFFVIPRYAPVAYTHLTLLTTFCICEYALSGERRIKLIMNETVEINDL